MPLNRIYGFAVLYDISLPGTTVTYFPGSTLSQGSGNEPEESSTPERLPRRRAELEGARAARPRREPGSHQLNRFNYPCGSSGARQTR